MSIRYHRHYMGSIKGKKQYALHPATDTHELSTASVKRHHKKELSRYLRLQERKRIQLLLPLAPIQYFAPQLSVPSTLSRQAAPVFARLVFSEVAKHQKQFSLPSDQIKAGVFAIIMPRVWKKLKKSFRKDVTGTWVLKELVLTRNSSQA